MVNYLTYTFNWTDILTYSIVNENQTIGTYQPRVDEVRGGISIKSVWGPRRPLRPLLTMIGYLFFIFSFFPELIEFEKYIYTSGGFDILK